MLTWPDSLPYHPDRESFTYRPGDGRRASETDSGIDSVQRRLSGAVKSLSLTLICSLDQVVRIERWWKEDTKGGVREWLMPNPLITDVPLTDEYGNALINGDGNNITTDAWVLVRFRPRGEPPAFTLYSAHEWQVTLDLEILP